MLWVVSGNLVTGLLNISVQAAVIFCVLLFVRAVFSLCRVPKKYACFLWLILFARLLMPVQPESPVGLWTKDSMPLSAVGNVRTATGGNAPVPGESQGIGNGNAPGGLQDIGNGNTSGGSQDIGDGNAPGGSQDIGGGNVPEGSHGIAAAKQPETGVTDILEGLQRIGNTDGSGKLSEEMQRVLTIVWGTGCLGFLLYGGISGLLLKKKLRCSIKREDNCYLVDSIPTAFVMGIFPPKIYLPSELAEEDLAYVILHERIHIKRGDYLVKMAAYLITCIYWFHPFVWAALAFLGKDIELSCDEAVLEELGENSRRKYADTLLRLSDGKRYFAGVPLAFGEGNTENRIRHIIKYRKPAVAAAVFAVILLSGLGVSLLTGRPEGDTEAILTEKGENGEEASGMASLRDTDSVFSEESTVQPSATPESEKRIGENAPDSINSRFPEPVELSSGHIVAVTGNVYHITVSIDGEAYEMADLCSAVNALMEIWELGEYIVVEGHISPNTSYYGFYSTESKQWERAYTGALLTWDENWEALENPIESVIYAESAGSQGVIYDWKTNKIAVLDLEEEWVYGLKREGDDITVTIVSYEGKSREVHFVRPV